MTLQIKPYISGDIMLLGTPMEHSTIQLLSKVDNVNLFAYSVVQNGEVLGIVGAKMLKPSLAWVFGYINNTKIKSRQQIKAFARIIKNWLSTGFGNIEIITGGENKEARRFLEFLGFQFNGYLFERVLR